MSKELSVEDHNDFTELVQNLMAHLGNTYVLGEVNQYKKDDKVMLSKEKHTKRMEEVRDHLFKDTDLPEDFPNVETVNTDIEKLKSFISGHQVNKEYMETYFQDMLDEGIENWVNSNAENTNEEMGGGRRKRRSRTRAGKKTYRKKRRATKKSASRRRRHK